MSKAIREEIKKYSLLPYALRVTPQECTDGSTTFVAMNPELPGCMSHGVTVEGAIQNLEEARELYITDLLERGLPVPMPAAAAPVAPSITGCSIETVIWEQLKVDSPAPLAEELLQTSIHEEIPILENLVA